MVGAKPLSNVEIDLITRDLPTLRDKTLFLLGIYTGFRIKECLSLRIGDVLNKERIEVKRCNMKRKQSSRSVLVHPILKRHLNALIASRRNDPTFSEDCYLFQSKKGSNRPITRQQAWFILDSTVKKLGLEGKISLHSTRKTFADKMYTALDKDLLKTSKALGHKNIASTISYLSFKTEELDKAILDMKINE